MAHRLGIQSQLPDVCSITLGSVQVNPLEMTNAYSTLAPGGMLPPRQPAAQVDRPERTAGGAWPRSRRRADRDPNVANEVTYALQGVISSGTGSAASIYPPRRRQDGQRPGQRRRVVLRLHGAAHDVRVGRLPEEQRPLINVEGVPVVYGGTIPAAIWHDFMLQAMDYGDDEGATRLTSPTTST